MRGHLRHVVRGRTGHAIQNAAVLVYEHDTLDEIADMFDADAGGAPLASPLFTNDQGEIEAWVAAPRRVDLRITDNDDEAFYAGNPALLVSFAPYTEVEDAIAIEHLGDPSDAHDASAISFNPAGTPSLTSLDVQTAVAELDTKKAGLGLANVFTVGVQDVGEGAGRGVKFGTQGLLRSVTGDTLGVRTATDGTYGNLFANQLAAGGTIRGGTLGAAPAGVYHYLLNNTAASTAFAIRGAASQSGNLTDWQLNDGTVASRVDSAGRHFVPQGVAATPGLAFHGDEDTGLFWNGNNTLEIATAGISRVRTAAGALNLQTSMVLGWSASTPGAAPDTVLFRAAADTLKTDDAFQVGNSIQLTPGSGRVSALQLANFNSANNVSMWLNTTGARIETAVATNVPLALRLAAAQTANALEVQDSAAAILTRVASDGGHVAPWMQVLAGAAGTRAIEAAGFGATPGTPGGTGTTEVARFTGKENVIEVDQFGRLTRFNLGHLFSGSAIQHNLLRALSATSIPLTLRGFTAQTANTFEILDNSGGLLTAFTSSGGLRFVDANSQVYRRAADKVTVRAGSVDIAEVEDPGIAMRFEKRIGWKAGTIDGTSVDTSLSRAAAGQILADLLKWKAANVQLTVGAAGAAAALPATPNKYFKLIDDAGVAHVVPGYLAA